MLALILVVSVLSAGVANLVAQDPKILAYRSHHHS
jgi:hypothetical protein